MPSRLVFARWRALYVGLGTAAVAAACVGSAAAGTTPRTVKVGNDTVTVPSSGRVMVDGQSVPVLPGAQRIVTIAPPPGSTTIEEGGQLSYQLPAGATGESFSVGALTTAAASGATSIPSTAVYSSPQRNRDTSAHPAAAIAWGCVMWASSPSTLGGRYTVRGTALTDDCTDPVQLKVTATLWWESGPGTPYQNEGSNSNSGTSSVSASVSHWCTKGTAHYWHTENQTIGYYNGVEAAGTDNSANPLVHCV